jgi:hypothetical protein
MTNFTRIILAAALAFVSMAARAADPLDEGPTTLTLEYRTAAGDRLTLKDYMVTTGLKQIASWREEGLITESRVLWSRYADHANWDMLVMLRFATPARMAEWKRIEARFPAGLPISVARLCTQIDTNPADLHFSGGESSPDSVFLVIPYDYLVSTAEYVKYVKSYIVPQYEGWIGEKVLASYRVYLGRFPVSRHWSALMILEYKDEASLGVREKTTAKVRTKLRENPEWKAIHESKDKVRVTRQYVLADLLK